MNSPKVRVILSAYNAAIHLGKAIDSMLEHSFENFELIIVNDGSADNTPEVLGKYTDPRIIVFTQEHLGLPKVLNKGISASRVSTLGSKMQMTLVFLSASKNNFIS